MGLKRIYKCERCEVFITGKEKFAYHMNAHRRTDPPKPKEMPLPPKPNVVQ